MKHTSVYPKCTARMKGVTPSRFLYEYCNAIGILYQFSKQRERGRKKWNKEKKEVKGKKGKKRKRKRASRNIHKETK